MSILNTLVMLSYAALIFDVTLQIRRIKHTKSSRDISLIGTFFRLSASLIIMLKLITLKDVPLLIGQGLFILTFLAYFYLVLTHVKHSRK